MTILESRYWEMCDSQDDCEFCKYNKEDCRLNFGYSQGRADAIKEVIEVIKGVDSYVADLVEEIFTLKEQKHDRSKV